MKINLIFDPGVTKGSEPKPRLPVVILSLVRFPHKINRKTNKK